MGILHHELSVLRKVPLVLDFAGELLFSGLLPFFVEGGKDQLLHLLNT